MKNIFSLKIDKSPEIYYESYLPCNLHDSTLHSTVHNILYDIYCLSIVMFSPAIKYTIKYTANEHNLEARSNTSLLSCVKTAETVEIS